MSNVVSFINMKGGVGKTTLAVNIGYTLSKEFGKKVLLIDADPQMNATQYTLNKEQVQEILEDAGKSLFSILSGNYEYPKLMSSSTKLEKSDVFFKINDKFDIIPSHLQIMDLDLDKRALRLRTYIKEKHLKDRYDVILIDLPPTISTYTTISLLASDFYLVPMRTDFLSYLGLPLLESYICRLKREYELNLEFLGIIFTMVQSRLTVCKDMRRIIAERNEWNNKIFINELKYTTEAEKALIKKDEKLPYLIEQGKQDLTSQVISITQEFMQKLRL